MIGSHIIPKFYLEQFSSRSKRGKDKPGRIWVYERRKEPQERATSVQGFENGYFAYVNPDGSMEETFEAVLADREAECNDVLVSSKFDTFHWPHRATDKLAFYIALLYSRATQRRTYSSKQWKKILDELRETIEDGSLIKEIAEATAQRLNLQSASEEIVRNVITRYIHESDTPHEAKNNFVSSLLDNAKLVADLLLKKQPWRILRPPEGSEFITTDNPLVTFVPVGNGLLHPGYGFRKEIADAAFPLANNACLLMGNAWHVPRTLDSEMLASLTQVLISISDRYVYSKTRSQEVNAVVQKHSGESRYGVNAFVPVGIKLPTAREFLRMHFGLEAEKEDN